MDFLVWVKKTRSTLHCELLEQSLPCRPGLHIHRPVEVSHFPSFPQSNAQVNSEND